MLRIEEVKSKVVEIGLEIGLEENSPLYPMFSEPEKVFNEGASVYVTSTEYHYIIFERGNISKHYRSAKIEDILYPLFKSITLALASKYEMENRNTSKDPRRLRWKKQLELLKIIDIDFRDTRRKEMEEILKNYPYVD